MILAVGHVANSLLGGGVMLEPCGRPCVRFIESGGVCNLVGLKLVIKGPRILSIRRQVVACLCWRYQ